MIDSERLKRAMLADEQVFRLLWPDENGVALAAERLADLYNRGPSDLPPFGNPGVSDTTPPQVPPKVGP